MHSFCGSAKIRRGTPALLFCHVILKARRTPNSKYPKQLKSLGDHIRKRRLDLALHQKQVAEQIGGDEDTICRWESNESRPQVQRIPAIIKFLNHNPFPLPASPGQRLAVYRQIHGLSQVKLAKKIGVDPKTVGLSERGERRLSKKLLKLLQSL